MRRTCDKGECLRFDLEGRIKKLEAALCDLVEWEMPVNERTRLLTKRECIESALSALASPDRA